MNIVMLWPIALMVFADLFYQICAKSIPATLNPYASLTITYLIAAAVTTALFFISTQGGNLIEEWKGINWTTFILGIAIVGLEVGSIYMYKVGWPVNTGYIVKSIVLAIALIGVGCLIFKEDFSMTKAAGIAVCLVGLYLINK